MCALYFYWRGDLLRFIDSYLVQNFLMDANSSIEIGKALIITAGFTAIFLLSVIKTWSSARLTNFQQKIQQVIWLVFFGAIATFFLSNEKSLFELVYMIPVIAYFWTHYMMLVKRRIFKFIMPVIMIVGILIHSGYTYASLTASLVVEGAQATGEGKTMILGSDLGYYKETTINTPCFNAHLTDIAFNGIDYYESSGELYKLFQKADPYLIIDIIGIMPRLEDRFPDLSTNYRNIGGNKYRKVSN